MYRGVEPQLCVEKNVLKRRRLLRNRLHCLSHNCVNTEWPETENWWDAGKEESNMKPVKENQIWFKMTSNQVVLLQYSSNCDLHICSNDALLSPLQLEKNWWSKEVWHLWDVFTMMSAWMQALYRTVEIKEELNLSLGLPVYPCSNLPVIIRWGYARLQVDLLCRMQVNLVR